jgi:signal peptidase I
MNEAVAPRSLRRRSKIVAALLTFFIGLLGFAYVRRLGWGIGFMLATPLLMFVGGRLGMPFSPAGYWAMLSAIVLLGIAAVATAIVLAHRLPEGAEPRWYNRWFHYCWIAVVGVLFANVLMGHRAELFGFEPFRVPSASMEPTLIPGDFITVDSRPSAMRDIRRGDIVAYMPGAHPKETWNKRVIGLPGEAIVVKGNGVEVDGKLLQEPWATIREPVLEFSIPFEHVVLGPDQYFLMGDNRPNSEDSRFTGPVARKAIRGKARAIWFHWMRPAGFDPSRITTLPSTTAR